MSDPVITAFVAAKTIRFKYLESVRLERSLADDDATPFDVTMVLREQPRAGSKGCTIVCRRCSEMNIGELENLLGWVLTVEPTTASDGAKRYLVAELEYGLLRLICESVDVKVD